MLVEKQSVLDEVGATALHAEAEQTYKPDEGQPEVLPSSFAPASPAAVLPLSPRQLHSSRGSGDESAGTAAMPTCATDEGAAPPPASSPVSLGTLERSPQQTPSPRESGEEPPKSTETPMQAVSRSASVVTSPHAADASPVSHAGTPAHAADGASPTALPADSPSSSLDVSGPPATEVPTGVPTAEDASSKATEPLVNAPTRRSKATCC